MQLTDPIFTDADKAREHLEAVRWPHGPICAHCGVVNEATALKGTGGAKGTKHRPGVYQCNACREQFTATVGTVFERSKIALNKWLLASYLMASSKKGVSALQLSRQLGVTYKTAWFMAHRLREAMAETSPAPIGGAGKTIEADETYVGGKEANRHAKDRDRSMSFDRKQKVVTLVERDGRARSFHVASVTSKTLRKALTSSAHRSSRLMTDGHLGYLGVGREFAFHGSVDHGAGEYVRGDVHSNTVESYFAILKRGVMGTFPRVGRKCAECSKVFVTRSPTRWWCDDHKPAPKWMGLRGRP